MLNAKTIVATNLPFNPLVKKASFYTNHDKIRFIKHIKIC